MNERGKLIILSGPSGAGKSTVISKVLQLRRDVMFSISATTRPPRNGEAEGVDYFFVSREKFEEMIEENLFLEYAEYVGNLYGTPRAPTEKGLSSGMSVILDIEVKGAMQVKKLMPEAVLVFFAPPSFDELERRLRKRGKDSEEKISIRLKTARCEYGLAGNYDYIVINEDSDIAAEEVSSIITSEKCRASSRIDLINEQL